MEKRIITITREIGSGGAAIGRQVANHLGFHFYDRSLVGKIAAESGFARPFVEEQGEYAPGGNHFSFGFLGRDGNGMSTQDYLYKIQREVILELAQKQPCVIVGRCSDYILAGREDCFHVFIHAPMEFCVGQMTDVYGKTGINLENRKKDLDRKRKLYYRYYTGREWGEAQYYHLALNSGELGIKGCAKFIVDALAYGGAGVSPSAARRKYAGRYQPRI